MHHETSCPPAGTSIPRPWTNSTTGCSTQKIEFTEADFTKEYDKIRTRLQAEIYKTAFSVDEAAEYDIKTDPEVEALSMPCPRRRRSLKQRAKSSSRG